MSALLGPDDLLNQMRRSSLPAGQRVLIEGVVIDKNPPMICVIFNGTTCWLPADCLIPVDVDWTPEKAPMARKAAT